MPKVKKANTKTIRKAVKKTQNIQLLVKAYKNLIFSLFLRATASLYHYSKNSIINYLDNTPQVKYTLNIYVEQQKRSPTKKNSAY